MKLVVSGSRSIKDKELVFDHIDIFNNNTPVDMIVCGGAKASDMAAVLWATNNGVPFTVYYPNYTMYGKIAPLVRNEKMASYGNALLAIWDGKSRGTQHMVRCMENLDKEVLLITVDGKPRERKDTQPQEGTEKDLADERVEGSSKGVH